jgi:hypothetical protein
MDMNMADKSRHNDENVENLECPRAATEAMRGNNLCMDQNGIGNRTMDIVERYV